MPIPDGAPLSVAAWDDSATQNYSDLISQANRTRHGAVGKLTRSHEWLTLQKEMSWARQVPH